MDQVQDQIAAPAGSDAIEFTYFSNKVLTTPAVRRIAMENNVSVSAHKINLIVVIVTL